MESKLPTVGLTIFSKISLMASQHQAINLAQGFPNFPVDEKLFAGQGLGLQNVVVPDPNLVKF
jgi:methionine aminotransferase